MTGIDKQKGEHETLNFFNVPHTPGDKPEKIALRFKAQLKIASRPKEREGADNDLPFINYDLIARGLTKEIARSLSLRWTGDFPHSVAEKRKLLSDSYNISAIHLCISILGTYGKNVNLSVAQDLIQNSITDWQALSEVAPDPYQNI